ncbi:MAG TPA: serine hydrolase domain-containing protein [Acidobacteriaceae bacterium]|jgi:CubicO group peptidase (beta-lactamase class C family)|nr:serine hydrolase domain-containing protein [Acidobacteriaceae bacterium]
MLSHSFTRRAVIRNLLRTTAFAAIDIPALRSLAQSEFSGTTGQQRGEMGRIAGAFRRQYRVPAMSIAISRNGRFAYDRADGMADHQHLTQAQLDSLFRIASLTKPITSVAIFSLIEQGKLNLNDKVFGPSGVLGTRYGKPPYKIYVADITVDNLLTHTAGGWPAGDADPMFHNDSWDQTKLITSTIENIPLTNPPGAQWAYSNFGYCVLGRVIEQVTGQPYESYVQTSILAPCGITGMQIARNKERQKAPNEVVYVGQYSEDPYKININRMDSDAGWIASSTQLVQFLNHVAGAPDIPALLKPATIRTMTTPVAVYPAGPARYARGWMVSGNGNWWHSGSLPGSTTIMVRTANGLCWAALCNTRTEPHSEMDSALDRTMWDMVGSVPGWNV